MALFLLSASCKEKADPLEAQFLNPPQTMKTGVYWYWIDDHISKEGVVADLEAMKKGGINCVFVGNIGDQGSLGYDSCGTWKVRRGANPVLSEGWWEVLHTMMKKAGELGIEVGMFNCPGWSHSGGPWVKPEMAMQYVVSSETRVKGPGKVEIKLPIPAQGSMIEDWKSRFIDNEGVPSPHFRDVKVVAFRVPEDYKVNLLEMTGAKVSVSPVIPLSKATEMSTKEPRSLHYLTKTSPTAPIALRYIVPNKGEMTLSVKLPKVCEARSFAIYPAGYARGVAYLHAKTNGQFVLVDSVMLNCTFPIPSIGYMPYSPIVGGFAAVSSDEYKIVIKSTENAAAIGQVVLSPTPVLSRYPEKMLARLYQGANPPYTEYKWQDQSGIGEGVDLVPSQNDVLDISDKMSEDGTLSWDVPEGEWLVLRTGMVPDEVFNSPSFPQDQGLEVDKYTTKYLQYHFDHFIGEVLKRIPAEDRKTFKVVIADSWEKGGTTFSEDFLEQMKARYGYDATAFLPAYSGHVVGTPEITERFFWDARRLQAENIGNIFMPGWNDILHKNGLESWIENYGDWGFPGEFLLYGKNSDRVGGEFWTGWSDVRYMHVAASCAHIYNKKEIYAEAYTGGWGFFFHPHSLKLYGDQAIAAGMNSPILHVYIQQPYDTIYPGIDAWFGIEFNRKNTWFYQIDQFTTYMKRCGLMNMQGLNVADVAYFIGEDVPVNSGPFELNNNAAKPGLPIPQIPKGYKFDYVNSDVLLNSMSVKNGNIVLPHGTTYKILMMPPSATMRPEVMAKIDQLAQAGATILLDREIKRSPSLQDYPNADKKVQEINKKWWTELSNDSEYGTGKGRILRNLTLEEAFALRGIKPDCFVSYDKFTFCHNTTGDKEIYYIVNSKDSIVQISPEFRVSGKQPEYWNPVTGEISDLKAWEEKDGSTIVPLQMEGNQSMFIVFRKKGTPASNLLADNFPEATVLTDINTPWKVKFNDNEIFRGPGETTFDTLIDWSKSTDPAIKYYSGIAFYTNTFNMLAPAADKKIYLDLGKVSAMCKVKINGQEAGGAWTPPYRVDISKYVKEGNNDIEVEVVSTWVNRLVGDQNLPKEQRKADCRFNNWRGHPEDKYLVEAGLIGPVRIIQ